MRKPIFSLCFVIVSFAIIAQNPLITDRPDNTESTAVMAPGSLQLEAGYLCTTLFDGADAKINQLDFLIRLGIFKNVEFRLITSKIFPNIDGTHIAGFGPVTIGFKTNLVKENNSWPAIYFLGHLTLTDIDESSYRPSHIAPDFRFAISKGINDMFSIAGNLGMAWDGEQAASNPLYSTSLGINITDWLGAFAEICGSFLEESKPFTMLTMELFYGSLRTCS